MNETDPFLWNLVNTNWTYLHNQVTEGSTILANNELIQLNEYLQAIIFSRKTLPLQIGTSSSGPSPTATNTTPVATISDSTTSTTTASTATTAMIPASGTATTSASKGKSTAPPPSTAAPLQTTTSSARVQRPPRASLSAAPAPTTAQVRTRSSQSTTTTGAVSSSSRIAVQNSTAADIYSDSEDYVPAVNTKKRTRKDGMYTHALLRRSDVRIAAPPAPHTTAPRLQPAPPKVAPSEKVYSYYNTDEVARLKEILPQYSVADSTGRKEIRSQLIQELNRTELSLLSKLRSMMDSQNLHPTAPPIAVPSIVEKLSTRKSARVGEMERGHVVVPVPAKRHYRSTRRDQEDLEVSSFVDRNAGHTSSSSDRRKGAEVVGGWYTLPTAGSAAASFYSATPTATAAAIPVSKRMSRGTIVEREEDFDAYDYPHADIDEETEHSSSRSEGENEVGNVSDDDGQEEVSEVVRSDAVSKPKRKYTKKTQAPSPTTTAATTTTTQTIPRNRNPTPFFDRDRGVLSNNYFKKYTDEENKAVEKYRKWIRLGKCTKAEAIGVLTQQLGRLSSSVTTKLNAGTGRGGSKKRR